MVLGSVPRAVSAAWEADGLRLPMAVIAVWPWASHSPSLGSGAPSGILGSLLPLCPWPQPAACLHQTYEAFRIHEILFPTACALPNPVVFPFYRGEH